VIDEYSLPIETIFEQRNGQDYSTKTSYLYTSNLQEAKDYPTQTIDIGGNERTFTYDEQGRLKTATDLGNSTYSYIYGDDGLALIESPLSQTTSGLQKETLGYGYDPIMGNLTSVTYGDGTTKQMTYRPQDNRLGTVTLQSGETIAYDYDEAGRIESQVTKAADGMVTGTVSYTYTANGSMDTVTDNKTGMTDYDYDPTTGALSRITYGNGSSIAYTYDLLGRTKTITEKASASGTAYTTTYDYDTFGNLKSVLDPAGGLTTMKYDVGNRLTERSLPNGVKSVYQYDDLDRVKSITHTNAQGQVLASVSYGRNGIVTLHAYGNAVTTA
jgi:YD repeat-containing protein